MRHRIVPHHEVRFDGLERTCYRFYTGQLGDRCQRNGRRDALTARAIGGIYGRSGNNLQRAIGALHGGDA